MKFASLYSIGFPLLLALTFILSPAPSISADNPEGFSLQLSQAAPPGEVKGAAPTRGGVGYDIGPTGRTPAKTLKPSRKEKGYDIGPTGKTPAKTQKRPRQRKGYDIGPTGKSPER
jgi:hypothetical protein